MAKRRQRKIARSSKRTTAAKLHEKAMKAKVLEEKRTIARLKREEHAKRSAEGIERASR